MTLIHQRLSIVNHKLLFPLLVEVIHFLGTTPQILCVLKSNILVYFSTKMIDIIEPTLSRLSPHIRWKIITWVPMHDRKSPLSTNSGAVGKISITPRSHVLLLYLYIVCINHFVV